GRIINSNPAALKVFSASKADLTSFESLFSSRQFFDEKENAIDQKDLPPNVVLRTQKKVEDFLVGVRSASGDICWLQMSSVPLVDDENAVIGVVTSFADITSLRKAQKDLEVHNALLFNASKLSSLGEMAAGIAHEINNPLAIVALRTEELNANLQQDTVDKSHLLKISKNIIDAVFRISRIIKSLKTFSRDNSAEPMQWHLFETILDDVKNILAQKIHLESIELHIAEELRRGALFCRNTQLSQVLLNLIVNSCDAIKHREEKWIKIHCEMDEEHFYINVDDSGDAIPAETVEKIFEPFFTTKSVGEGTGLGLHIVRSLLQHNKATISYMRVENATRFRIKFPKDSWRKGEHAGTIHEKSY
ncbi:MAG: GHKL domain-containing protein, partial [Bdellovibrionales bacterium]|nr:GHKL domain-containing protein [Bdellovibrionales bacterium]